MSSFHATTIFAVQHNGKSAMSGDGQVTFRSGCSHETYREKSEKAV